MTRMTGRPAALALALAAALAGGPAAEAVSPGAYLAARQADRAGDVEAAADRFGEALRQDPRNVALLEQATLAAVAAGRMPAATQTARRLVALDRANRIAGLTMFVSDFAAGREEAARLRLAEQAQSFNPLTLSLLRGWTAFGTGDRAGAEAAFASLTEGQLQELFGRYHLGLMRAADGDHAGALAAFEEAGARVSAPTSRLAAAQGAALEALGRTEEARAVYAAADAAPFGDPLIAAALARLDAGEPAAPLVRDAREGAAEALFSLAAALAGEQGRRLSLAHAQLAVHLRPDLSAARLLVAELLDADAQYESAARAYESVPDADPYWVRAQIGRAGALQSLERDDAAAEALRALVARAPGAAEAHLALADTQRRLEQFEAAAASYGAAVDLLAAQGRESWTVHYQRGIAFERAKLWPQAEAEFKRALALEPDQPLVLNYLGYSWVEMGLNLDEAKAMIERAVEQRPEDGYITDSLGWVLYRLGDFEGAVTWLEKAVELAPVDPVINDHLGDALWRVGRKREAAFQWRRARSFDPEPEVAERIRRKLAFGLDQVLEEEAAAAAAGAPPPRDGG